MALAVFVLIALIGYELFKGSHLALQKFGWHFLVSSDWDPVNDVYGALPFIFGTLVSSAIALIIAVPISIATAVYLTELAPLWLRQPLTMFIELLAAVPSVILGLWGIFVMVPFLRATIFSRCCKNILASCRFSKARFTAQHDGRAASSSPS
jgi:phosphate transport system permease protein